MFRGITPSSAQVVDKRKEAHLGFNQCSFPGAYRFLIVESITLMMPKGKSVNKIRPL